MTNPSFKLKLAPSEEPITVVPWLPLEKATIPGLRKIAAILRSSFVDDTGQTIQTFGQSGTAVADDLQNYIACAEQKAVKEEAAKERRKTKETEKDHADPAHQEEVRILDAFKEACERYTGVPAIINWGRDRKLLRRVIGSGWEAQQIIDLIEPYYANGGKGWLFRDGSILAFTKALINLKGLGLGQEEKEDRSIAIPSDQIAG